MRGRRLSVLALVPFDLTSLDEKDTPTPVVERLLVVARENLKDGTRIKCTLLLPPFSSSFQKFGAEDSHCAGRARRCSWLVCSPARTWIRLT